MTRINISREVEIAAARNIKEYEYWMEQLSGEPVKSCFPFDYKQPVGGMGERKVVSFLLDEETVEKLLSLSKNSPYTRHIIFLTVLILLLGKYTGNDDILVGTPIYRQEKEANLINTMLVLRSRLQADISVKELLVRVRQTVVEAIENQAYPVELLPEKLALALPATGEAGDFPLFDVVLLVQEIHDRAYLRDIIPNVVFSFKSCDREIKGAVEYKTSRYREVTIAQIIRHFTRLLQAILANPDASAPGIEILSQEEKKELLVDFNDTAADYPAEKTIADLFAEQVQKTPANTALTGAVCYGLPGLGQDKRVVLTYRDFDRTANRLAGSLQGRGVIPGSLVAIMLDRSVEMAACIFAVLKAGCAYLPIDPAYPQERIAYMLSDSCPKIILTSRSIYEGQEISGTAAIYIEEETGCAATALAPALDPSICDNAYVIYTSGSTGKPKGVLVRQRSVVNIITALQRLYPLGEADTYLFKTAYIFDVSVAELFGWFQAGGKLAVLENGAEKEPGKIIAAVENFAVTHINFVPSMFNVFVDELNEKNIAGLATLKYIFLAGEALPPELLSKFEHFGSHVKPENIYGPTEGTVYASCYSSANFTGSGSIPIGKPMQNVRLFILSREERLQPIGVPGELYIAGAGVASGYLNRPELTAASFIDAGAVTRFALSTDLEISSCSLSPLYKTGDLCRRLPDGNIEYLGRMDFQVKIRGFRIEIGEIENRLRRHEGIKEALVIDRKSAAGETYLCAYLVMRNTDHAGTDLTTASHTGEIRQFLSQTLPEYMIPSYFVFLDEIPLNPSGKVDRKALPEPGSAMITKEYVPATDEVEKKLVDIWSAILDLGDTEAAAVSIDNNFFELGGHSLKATRIMARVHRELRVKIGMTEFFNFPTIRGLARFIKGLKRDRFANIEAVEKKSYYSLSSAQKRLYVLQHGEPVGTGYNILTVLKLTGSLEKKKFADTFRELIRRHESLRTSFKSVAGEAKQQVHDPRDMKFEIKYYETVAGSVLASPAAFQHLIGQFIQPFDLSSAPLLRVGLIPFEDEQYILMVDMHHIISDGTSLAILTGDFMSLYAGEKLPQLRIYYKDFSEWQNSAAEKEKIARQGEFWLGQFSDGVPLLKLPYDFPRPALKSYQGNTLFFGINREETTALNKLALEREMTLYMVLLALYFVFLRKISGQEDIVVGTPTAGRPHADLEPLIGMFVNTLSLRNYPQKDKRFSDFLQEVKERTLEAYENRDYPFADLVEKLYTRQDASRNPLFDVFFTLQNKEMVEKNIPGLRMATYEFENKTAKFDLVLMGFEVADELRFSIEYSTKLFKKSTIERFIGYFKDIIAFVLRDIAVPLNDIDISCDLVSPESEFSLELDGDFTF